MRSAVVILAAVAALWNSVASAGTFVLRSSTTGPIAASVANPAPGAPISIKMSVSYADNGRAFAVGRPMEILPTIVGGSGSYWFAFGTESVLPPGIVADADGALTGTPTRRGIFDFGVLVIDRVTGATRMVSIRIIIA